jgi:hypothetical protein
MDETERGEQPVENSIDIIAAALVEKFGDDAIRIAQQQAEAASGDTRDTWAGVVAELSR